MPLHPVKKDRSPNRKHCSRESQNPDELSAALPRAEEVNEYEKYDKIFDVVREDIVDCVGSVRGEKNAHDRPCQEEKEGDRKGCLEREFIFFCYNQNEDEEQREIQRDLFDGGRMGEAIEEDKNSYQDRDQPVQNIEYVRLPTDLFYRGNILCGLLVQSSKSVLFS